MDFGKPHPAVLPPLDFGRPVDHEPLLSREEVAAQLGVSKQTLAAWACHGVGPPYFNFNGRKVRYRQSDLTAWMQTQLRVPTPQAK